MNQKLYSRCYRAVGSLSQKRDRPLQVRVRGGFIREIRNVTS